MRTSFVNRFRLTLFLLASSLLTVSILVSPLDRIDLTTFAQTVPPAEPPVPLSSLKTIPVPEPSNLDDFVRDREAAIALGKALFWDMQVGSDGIQACASCHFHAGADSRSKNQLSPGLLRVDSNWNPSPDSTFSLGGPNYQLKPEDYPFHRLADVNDRASVISDTNDIASSQGVSNTQFLDVNPDHAEDQGLVIIDPIFNVLGNTGLPANVRRVEPRHTPSVINAVFNFRNFWDGRAENVFNGMTSFGSRDTQARVLLSNDPLAYPLLTQIQLNNSSLASQAVAPIISNTESSFDGRTRRDIGIKLFRKKGKKLLSLKPLAKQKVSPQDGVLGTYSDTKEKKGLTVSYDYLVKTAFHSKWWDSVWIIKADASGNPTFRANPNLLNDELNTDEFNQMEWNFSLFFGIAVQMYQATLVSDDTPLDRFFEGDTSALTAQQQRGLQIFQTNRGRCINCHGGAELTNASVRHVEGKRIFRRSGDALPGTPITNIFDSGFNPIGVRPVTEDLALGGTDPFGVPLSEARLLTLGLFTDPLLNPVFDPARDKLAVDGAFKTPGLRNIELTAPYFHNGGYLTLTQVIDFYNRGGDFQPIATRDGFVVPLRTLGLTQQEKQDLVAFLLALTDERVRYQRAPFDHPEILIPNGHPGDHTIVTDDGTGRATDSFIRIPAVGRTGGAALPNFLTPR